MQTLRSQKRRPATGEEWTNNRTVSRSDSKNRSLSHSGTHNEVSRLEVAPLRHLIVSARVDLQERQVALRGPVFIPVQVHLVGSVLHWSSSKRMSLRHSAARGSLAGWARTHQYQLVLLVIFLSSIAIITPLASTRRRERLLNRWRLLLNHAAALTLGGSKLLNEPARAVRGYIDESAGRVYSILVRQFDLQLDRLVDAALRQAKSVLIDPDMPHGVSSLISDTLERIGPELTQAIRKQADVAILRPIARRLQPDGWQGPRTAPNSRTSHHLGATRGAVPGRALSGQNVLPELGNPSSTPQPLFLPAYHSPRPALLRRSIRTPCAIFHEAAHRAIFCLMTLARWAAAVIRAARAHVLYTLQPFDRSMWSCFRDPQYWLFTALGATPLPSWLPAAWWFLVFAWQDGTDEHQVASFIVGLESASAS